VVRFRNNFQDTGPFLYTPVIPNRSDDSPRDEEAHHAGSNAHGSSFVP
jgi:hypothetical protein